MFWITKQFWFWLTCNFSHHVIDWGKKRRTAVRITASSSGNSNWAKFNTILASWFVVDNYTTQFIEDDNPIGESLLTNQLNGMTEGILNNAQLTELPKHPLIASSKSDHPWIHSAWDPIAHHDLMRSWIIAVLAGSEIENRECWLGNFIRIFHRGRARGCLPVPTVPAGRSWTGRSWMGRSWILRIGPLLLLDDSILCQTLQLVWMVHGNRAPSH